MMRGIFFIVVLFAVSHAHAARAAIYNITPEDHKPIELISQQFYLEPESFPQGSEQLYFEFLSSRENKYSLKLLWNDSQSPFLIKDRRAPSDRKILINTETHVKLPIIKSTLTETVYRVSQPSVEFGDGATKEETINLKNKIESVSREGIISFSPEGVLQQSGVNINLHTVPEIAFNEPLLQISHVYEFVGQILETADKKFSISVKIKYTDTGRGSKSVYYFSNDKHEWTQLASYNDVEKKIVRASLPYPFPRIAVFQDPVREDGIASWYAYKNCLCAASRKFPKGSLVKVTRLKSRQSVIVKINDYGPEEWTNRLIDLDKKAFKMLGSVRSGLIYVSVEPYYDKI